MGLSGRQADVLALLLEGLNDKEIAAALRISYYTLRTHMRMLLAKQNVDTRLKLVVRTYAILREISEARPRQDWLANEGEL